MRWPESTFWPAFDAALPGVLGAALDAAVSAIVNLPGTKIDRLPRMADFALWATAAEPGLGLTAGQFMASYRDNRESAHAQALESCPIVPYVLDAGRLDGTSGRPAGQTRRHGHRRRPQATRTGPRRPRVLGGVLRRLAPDLRTAGLDVTFGGSNERQRRRFITLTRLETQNTVHSVHIVQDPQKQGSAVDGTDANGPDVDDTPDANGVATSADAATDGTVRGRRDDELQPYSNQGSQDDDAVYF